MRHMWKIRDFGQLFSTTPRLISSWARPVIYTSSQFRTPYFLNNGLNVYNLRTVYTRPSVHMACTISFKAALCLNFRVEQLESWTCNDDVAVESEWYLKGSRLYCRRRSCNRAGSISRRSTGSSAIVGSPQNVMAAHRTVAGLILDEPPCETKIKQAEK